MLWNFATLSIAPQIFEDPQRSTPDVKAIFYEGLPYRGKPSRVFAYYGLPKIGAGEKVPAMVLVHGGGGSAFIPWVRLWVERGYAAISMDTCGSISSGGYQNHQRHEYGGPPGCGGFDQINHPIHDQWTYHAVADVVFAHSLIRSFPQIDPDKIGVTGVSWGGYLVCIASAIDKRFKFSAPVYGCGFLGDNSAWLGEFKKMAPEKSRQWLELWDPSVYLADVKIPMLWITGTNDFAYPLDSLQKSYRLSKAPRTLSICVKMPHGHGGPGENPKEIYTMAEAMFNGGVPLARISTSGKRGSEARVEFESRSPIIKAELNFTTDRGKWQDRDWKTTEARLDASAGKASALLSQGVTVYYFNLTDSRGLIVSSEHEEITGQ